MKDTAHFWIAQALLPDGWTREVRLRVEDGRIAQMEIGQPPPPGAARVNIAVPGLSNLHSHAFQRGMAGLTEIGGASGDSFWSWRGLMYRFLERLSPEGMQAIAELAYAEMLESGFTRVGEFHYLHHDIDGTPYAQRGEMAWRIAEAARTTGIGLTLLPVFYAHSGFGAQPPLPAQKRLTHDIDGFSALLEDSRRALAKLPDAVLGLAPHSLRAVAPEQIAQLPALTDGPIHIHIAEQTAEIDACLAWSGQRPVQWLYAHANVDARWCLVHATHIDEAELSSIVQSGAVAGLCPITEANLGDGLFPAREFIRRGGRFGVGSDSNVLIDAAEELRLLEYGQRLLHRGRNVLTPEPEVSSGRYLFEAALNGGAQALGVEAGLRIGAPADFVELDTTRTSMALRDGDTWLDGWLFATCGSAVSRVWRAGKLVVEHGRHRHRAAIEARFRKTLEPLLHD